MGTSKVGRALTVAEVRAVLDAPRLSLNDLANAAGVSRSALESYRAGRSQPPLLVRTHLAAYLERHAKALEGVVRRLRG